MKELVKRVVVAGVAMLSVACLAGCPKNSPENEGQIKTTTTVNNPEYEKMRQQTKGASPSMGGGANSSNAEYQRRMRMQGGSR